MDRTTAAHAHAASTAAAPTSLRTVSWVCPTSRSPLAPPDRGSGGQTVALGPGTPGSGRGGEDAAQCNPAESTSHSDGELVWTAIESLATAVIALRWRRRSHQSHFLCWYPAAPAKPVGIKIGISDRTCPIPSDLSATILISNLLEATPGIEPGIAVLQMSGVSDGAHPRSEPGLARRQRLARYLSAVQARWDR